jgi:hypothetical protein
VIVGAVCSSCAGLALLASPAAAVPTECGASVVSGTTATVTCAYTGVLQTFMVPADVSSVMVEADGAQGGQGEYGENFVGGKGAKLVATFGVSGGETLNVLVGGEGGPSFESAGGGGGGSFVYTRATRSGLLLAAAGGGGGDPGGDEEVTPGSASETAYNGAGSEHGAGGKEASGGGGGGAEGGGGGAGLETDGVGDTSGKAKGGRDLEEGGGGGSGETANGGFGGGGGAGGNYSTPTGGGGGGGYNGGGGGGGLFEALLPSAGGGGGSFSASTPSTAETGVQQGNGLVKITYTVPPPCITAVGHGVYKKVGEPGRLNLTDNLSTDLEASQALHVRYESGTVHFRLIKLENATCTGEPGERDFHGDGAAAAGEEAGYALSFSIYERGGGFFFESKLMKGAKEVETSDGPLRKSTEKIS